MAEQSNSGLHDSVELKDVLERARKTGYGDSMTPAEPPLIIRNGLMLKRQATGKSEDFGSYTYALSPLTTAPRNVDWKIIAFSGADIVCEHISCHEVKPDDDLDDVIAECRSNNAVAVILLNCDESYSLPKTVQSSLTKLDYPVLVLAAEDGRKLSKTLLEEDEDGDFLAKVLEKEPIEQLPKQLEPKSMQGKVLELCKDFKKQTRQLLHPSGHATCVSEDSELLKQVADAFDHYEQEVQKLGSYSSLVSNHCICEDLKKWRDKCDFGREFPLYLVLVYRLMRKRVVYICNHFDGFIHHTVLKMEELPWRVVASTVETLVSRGNFQIKCQGLAPEKNAVGVITFLGEACEHILCIPFSESQPRKTKGAGKVHRTPIATKMFWTSLAVKFRSHGECQEPTNYLWQENIIKGCEDLVLKDDVISAMGSGLDFGRQLKLSPEVAFGSLKISQFLALPTFVRPFKHIRTFLKEVNLSNYINEEVDLANLMQSLLDSYRMWIAQHPDDIISQLSTQKCLDEAISEGIAFLDELYTIKYQKQWNSKDSELAEKFYRWLTFLIRLVDVRKPNAEQCLRLFLEHRSRFCKEHKKKIIARVKMLIKEKFQEITIQQFYCLYKVFFRYWEPEFLKDYLMNVKFQEDDRISPSWSDFFQEVMKHLTDPRNHQFLFEFLKRTGEHYAMKHSRFEFLVDLLVLKVPEPCTQEHSKTDIPSKFYAFLQYYFCDEHLVDKMSEFLVSF